MQKQPETSEKSQKQPYDLYGKIIKGGFWVFATRIMLQILYFVRFLILARLLLPSDFGMLGIAILTMNVFSQFTTTGFQAALVQKKSITASHLDSAWTVGIIRGIVLFGIVCLAAPYAARFFNHQEATTITRIVAFSLLLTACNNIYIVYLQKYLEFHKQFIYYIGGTLVDIFVAVYIALTYQSVWALVWGKLAGELVRCVLGYIICKQRPHIKLSGKEIKELWRFGRWISGSTMLGFLLNKGDDMLVGKILGSTALGLYQTAYKISNISSTQITNIISHVTFPVYSKLQEDIPRLKAGYLKVLQFVAFLTFPITGLIFILAPDFVRLFLKHEWTPMTSSMQVLAIWGLFRSLGTTSGSVFSSVGRPEIGVRLQLIRVFVFAVLVYPLTRYFNIAGTAVAVLAGSLAAQPFTGFMIMKVIQCRMWDLGRRIAYPLAGTMFMTAMIAVFRYAIFVNISIISFFLLVIIGILSYIAAAYYFDRKFSYGIKPILRDQVRAFLK
jgi:lipopolysaccharide exporter